MLAARHVLGHSCEPPIPGARDGSQKCTHMQSYEHAYGPINPNGRRIALGPILTARTAGGGGRGGRGGQGGGGALADLPQEEALTVRHDFPPPLWRERHHEEKSMPCLKESALLIPHFHNYDYDHFGRLPEKGVFRVSPPQPCGHRHR